MPKTTTTKRTTSRTSTKKAASRTRGTTKPKVKRTAKKAPSRKTSKKPGASTSKTTSNKKTAKKKTTSAAKKKTAKKKTSTRRSVAGRSLIDRARDCRDLEECRQFIIELSDAAEQANDWLNELGDQALSAEHTRDLYAEQISDLIEAIDLDRARIASLEADLNKARSSSNKSSASDAVLRKLSELGEEVRKIRADLERLARGRSPIRPRGVSKKSARAPKQPTVPRSRTTRRRDDVPAGPHAKYSVLRGAACSLGVGKYGYPPEVCAPASFDRSEAARILGTYAQNDYGGLARWALITGLPIDDGGRPSAPAPSKRRTTKSSPKRKKKTTKVITSKAVAQKASKPRSTKSRSAKPKARTASGGRSSQQILDQVLLTVARI